MERFKLTGEHLVFKALVALDEVIEESRNGPIRPSFAVRFACAYLYSVSKHDRTDFDALFAVLQDPMTIHTDTIANYVRPTQARTILHGICRGVGFDYAGKGHQQLCDARKPKAQRMKEAAFAEACCRSREKLAADGGGAKPPPAPAPES